MGGRKSDAGKASTGRSEIPGKMTRLGKLSSRASFVKLSVPVETVKTDKVPLKKHVLLLVDGEERAAINQIGWETQQALEDQLGKAVRDFGGSLSRAHPYKHLEKHGVIASQKEAVEVFSGMDPRSPLLLLARPGCQAHHLLPGLVAHQGPILTCGIWTSPDGLLALNALLSRIGKPFSTLWSVDFSEKWFLDRLGKWLQTGTVRHPVSHVSRWKRQTAPAKERSLAEKAATEFRSQRTLLGIFDEGLMGRYETILPDEVLFPLGIFKERLSQAEFYRETRDVDDDEARDVYRWMMAKGMVFQLGENEDTDLTLEQVLLQCKMYIAAVRLAERTGCSLIGIPYRQGLVDLLPSIDLVEGMLNNTERPPVKAPGSGRNIFEKKALLHFHGGDEPAGLDGLLNHRVAELLGTAPDTTCYDIRWGGPDPTETVDGFVWTLQCGGAPPSHFEGGWKVAECLRRDPAAFPRGGGSLRGVARRGEIVWSCLYLDKGRLTLDLGRGRAVTLPRDEVQRRARLCSPECSIMNAVLNNVTPEQMLARQRSPGLQVIYAGTPREADRFLAVKAALADALGLDVFLCGSRR